MSRQKPRQSDDAADADALAAKETRFINILRIVTLILLLSIATLASLMVYTYTANYETTQFENDFKTNAQHIIDRFHDFMDSHLGAINALADTITSHAISAGEEFPRVTLPNFAVHGSNTRIQADAFVIQWSPLVTDENRLEWEEYALANRFQLSEAYDEDMRLRSQQDAFYGLSFNYTSKADERPLHPNDTVIDDGTGFHPRIYSNGAVTPRGDEKENSGPYLPLWQRSPVTAKRQFVLNFNVANSQTLHGVLPRILESGEAIMNRAEIALPKAKRSIEENLLLSQYRQESYQYLEDPITFIAYPVFDSFDEDRQVAGILAASTYWRKLFNDLLPEYAKGYICILENTYNQTLVYRVDGKRSVYLGEHGHFDSMYEHLESTADINEHVNKLAKPKNRSYTQVPLSRKFGRYRLRIYPTKETQDHFATNKPWVYTAVVLSVILLTTVVLLALDRFVVQRQRIVMDRLIGAAESNLEFEKDLNAFLAHEVRNPIAAAISAHGFVASAISEMPKKFTTEDDPYVTSLEEDVKVIGSSLYFVDDFLRSILDIHASEANKLEVSLAPICLFKDVFEPVQSMLHRRDGGIDLSVECPDSIIIMTDCLRLKQVMINLGRNSLKFTTKGFVRFRAAIIDGLVEIYVEDSGPGIPADKRNALFEKFQKSLDVQSQGTGIGLSLCQSLVSLLNGDIYLDENYESGVEGFPGSRFVVQLKQPLLSAEAILPSCKDSDTGSTGSMSISLNSPKNGICPLPENLSVLFVDDDNVLRKLFSRAVTKVATSWTIAEAASGEAALNLVKSNSYGLIFMDQYMTCTEKQLLGTETVRELRARGFDGIICGLSANDMEGSFMDAGADTFSLKPFPCGREAMTRELIRIYNSRSLASSLEP